MIDRAAVAAPSATPRHVAIVIDGHRRWAAAHELSAAEGRRRGLAALRRTVVAAARAGVEILTVHLFGEEQTARPADEQAALLALAARFARLAAPALRETGVRLRFIGRRERLPAGVIAALAAAEEATAGADALVLNVAIDGGARGELCGAIRALAHEVAAGRLAPAEIDDAALAGRLSTAGLPDPDLLIRTGGELRLANFLLYQAAYAELWSTPTPWPEFGAREFAQALDEYAARERRFGK